MSQPTTSCDAVIVGAGFAGMYMLHRLRQLGFRSRVFEAGSGVGGTWYWNRYPGARCDVESLEYQYSFSDDLQREWTWTERYAGQAEILDYCNHVADKFELRRDIQFNTRVTAAHFDESTNRWRVAADQGDVVEAPFLIAATGCLSASKLPEIPGIESFQGDWYHTGRWPHEGVDFTGKRVAVIGTGSSGIQSIPLIARQAEHLVVFQRTPNFSLPALNCELSTDQIEDTRARFQELRALARRSPSGIPTVVNEQSVLEVEEEERRAMFEERWGQGGFRLIGAYIDLLRTNEANEQVAEFVRAKIAEVVKDPAVAETLQPDDHPLGTKRICIDTGYFETYNRPNVSLVNIRETPIDAIVPEGVRTGDRVHAVDSIVFATGFDAMTGALLAMDIRGRDGLPLGEAWGEGPKTYLGIGVVGFPNLFTITGPGSPSVLSNMIVSIEQHVEWIGDCMGYMREHDTATIEATQPAQDAWVQHVNELAAMTLYPQANSWYLGANVPGKPRVFMPYVGGVGVYAEKCADVAAKGYEGFTLLAARVGAPA
jgi:cyclohexanone monooxygenase